VIIVVKGIVLLSQKGFNENENNIKSEAWNLHHAWYFACPRENKI
jgi:hypothetical protein